MGMDVYGNNPTGKKGEYFRNPIHYWKALADYIHVVAPTIAAKCTYWYANDGDGLEVSDALELADALQKEIDSGRCETYAKIKTRIGLLERDTLGNEHGLWVIAVDGNGAITSRPSDATYPFDIQNVKSFVAFLRECGGFRIW
jgi:hypothetical protein